MKRGVHNIAFWPNFAFQVDSEFSHFKIGSPTSELLFFVVQVHGFVVSWGGAEVFLVQGGPVGNLQLCLGPVTDC